ncbi:YtxH domain-containing protein [Vibrio sp.]|uniref:YtxH domain-containing protein n=1 Tax=Vibrio sp. TaxID=678 RepID=UPI003AA918EE
MSKLVFWIVLIGVGVGVGIGINYQDEILDILNMRDMENLYDHIEDAADNIKNGTDSLSDTISELAE